MILEKAIEEDWSDERIAEETWACDLKDISEWKRRLKEAREIVDAESPAKSFRLSVKKAIRHALEEGLSDEESIDKLAVQICYRAADLSCLLRHEEKHLWQYSQELRKTLDDEDFPD